MSTYHKQPLVVGKFYNKNNVLITKKDIYAILKKYGIKNRIHDLKIWQRAFVHKSYSKANSGDKKVQYDIENEEKGEDDIELQTENLESMEFRGDGLLQAISTEYLCKKYPNRDEGFLTKMRSKLVRTQSLAKISRHLGLNKFMIISAHEEENNNARNNPKHLEDVMEAFLCAIYLDLCPSNRGKAYNILCDFIENVFNDPDAVDFDNLMKDSNYKDQLGRYFQREFKCTPIYFDDKQREEQMKGINGDTQVFYIFILHPKTKRVAGKGFSKQSKKMAQQFAAKNALERLGIGDSMAKK